MKNDYPYDSVEWRLESAKEEIDKALGQVKKFRAEAGSIAKVPVITIFGAYGEKIQGYKSSFENYLDWNYYWGFDSTKKEHIQRCYDAAIKWIEGARVKVEELHTQNLPILENNKAVAQKIRDFMETCGIKASYSVYETVGRKKDKQLVTKNAGYAADIGRECRLDDNYEIALRQLKKHEEDAGQWKEKLLAAIDKKERDKEKSDKELLLLAKSLELANKWGIKYNDNSDLIFKVQNRAEQEYCEKSGFKWENTDFVGDVVVGLTALKV